ncbi:glycoside hydrolase family 43 and carbohydrate-binding module family 35 protein [Schizophyllum amplum]|uniref:Glycoside hydrolase family 43 and carbohydrate-binding module family 35 protein n=1 Tax=Schizophyllum amplum TaxID=97359 RepID=A0A550CLH1_9AGAR|nr:glycoside hydrolase family 43 and carbohydrate-binding module family 35 protein [Auriculariopsis ampla]
MLFSLAGAFLLGAVAQAAVIVPGAAWTDTDGNVIQAHGGGFLEVDSTWYWFGEDKSHNSGSFKAVSCYSSSDLMTWTREQDALSPVAGTNISTDNIVERPKVIYNEKNSEYVMWFHSDSSNYGAAQQGVATASTPCGPYDYRGSFQPLGAESRDMGLFVDGTAYVLYASDNNQNFKISRLDEDFYTVEEQVNVISASTLESPGVLKHDGTYYLIASHTSGWAPNPNKFFTASSISGTFSSEADIAPSSTRTYYSQNTYNLPLGSDALYAGDRWRPNLLGSSRYIWLPLSFASGRPELVWADVWSVDIGAGTYTIAEGTTYEAESATRSGNATLESNSAFSEGQAVGYLGNGGSVIFEDVEGTGAAQWVSIYYANGDSDYRTLTVSVNGGDAVTVDQPDSGGGHVVLSVPVQLTLNAGSNTLTFGSGQDSYAGDLDKIIVYTAS